MAREFFDAGSTSDGTKQTNISNHHGEESSTYWLPFLKKKLPHFDFQRKVQYDESNQE
jgi:hypothetical protein